VRGTGPAGAAPFLVVQFIYNAIRTGSPFRTAYATAREFRVWHGDPRRLLGSLGVAGKSIFLYNRR